jgi:hypothetical protein
MDEITTSALLVANPLLWAVHFVGTLNLKI